MCDSAATPAPGEPEAAWRAWYDKTYGADYPNGTEFDSGEMYEAFAAGFAAAAGVRGRGAADSDGAS
jgi:hypothetical protein